MTEISEFGQIILVVSLGLSLAILGRAITERVGLPAPALVLLGAALASDLFPELADELTIVEVERIAVVALIVILFDGGLHIGWRRFRGSAWPILSLGTLGTFATAAVMAAAAHWLLGVSWTVAGLIGAALAPTDPAVVFSVLGNRVIRGRSGTILEGESGANDPVGIALMIGMIEFATREDASFSVVLEEFAVEMVVGLAVGAAGAALLLPLMRRVPLPEPTLYPLRVLAGAGVVYGLASVAHGSGFIAVFAAGILLGDAAAPRKGEIESLASSLSSLAEITVFIALGLTIDLTHLVEEGALWDGLLLAVVLTFLARPLVTLPLLVPVRLRWGERLFVTWGGLKGAVPILLAALAVISAVEERTRIYELVFVVVLFSVVVQGSLVPFAARSLGVPMRTVDHTGAAARTVRVRDGALAAGKAIRALPLGERAWVGAVVRDGAPVRVDAALLLVPGDVVHVYCNERDEAAMRRIFEGTADAVA